MATAPHMRTVDITLSSTVLDCFVRAAIEFGVPSRVCCDHGGENILVGMLCSDIEVLIEEASSQVVLFIIKGSRDYG